MLTRVTAGVLQRAVGGRPRQGDQAVQPPSRGTCHLDEGRRQHLANRVRLLRISPIGLLPRPERPWAPRSCQPGRGRDYQPARSQPQGDTHLLCYSRIFIDLAPSQHIFDSIKASLERLQLDYVDVLQCELSTGVVPLWILMSSISGHRFDYTTPIEETVGEGATIMRF